jgi:ubiquinone/menaquinone biosynthesis C-methylase UbiE
MSFFVHSSAAKRYAAARPYFHPVVRERIAEYLGEDSKLDRALDVACGTGQSTRILADLAHHVVGVDRSAGMLGVTGRTQNVSYVQSAAEQIPFTSASFNLITVALAFHWFDRPAFLNEASRLLRPGGSLIIYDNSFRAEMVGNPKFRGWFVGQYLGRYPSPGRNREPFTDEDARSFGFEVLWRETYQNVIEFSLDELVAYLMTQSNIIAAIEEGAESVDEVRSWLSVQLASQFDRERADFLFGGPITCLRRLPN